MNSLLGDSVDECFWVTFGGTGVPHFPKSVEQGLSWIMLPGIRTRDYEREPLRKPLSHRKAFFPSQRQRIFNEKFKGRNCKNQEQIWCHLRGSNPSDCAITISYQNEMRRRY